jgi:hypothetical protein
MELARATRESDDDRNAVNPRIGSGMQQARERPEEEAAEVVRNHEGGTCGEGGSLSAEARLQSRAGVDSGSHVDEGGIEAREARKGQLAETKPRRGRSERSDPDGTGALNGSQGHGGRRRDVPRDIASAESAEDPEGQPATARRPRGEQGSTHDLLREHRRGTRRPFERRGDLPDASKATRTRREPRSFERSAGT